MSNRQCDLAGIGDSSFFQDQVQQNTNTRSRKKQVVHYLNVDSRFRHVENRLESKYIQTNPDFIQPDTGGIVVKITNPPQLTEPNTNGLATDRIPECIHIIFAWTSPNSPTNAPSIGGIPSSELIYNPDNGTPTWYATLLGYDESVDEASYRIDNLPEKNKSIDEFGIGVRRDQIQLRQVVSIQNGYRLSNHYRISLKNTIRNVVSARLVSSEFPVPHHQPKILARTSFCSEIELPELKLLRTVNLSPINNETDDEILRGWGHSTRSHLRDWEIEPFIHHSVTGINTREVSLLKRIVQSKQIKHIYQLPFVGAGSGNPYNQFSDNHQICVTISGQYDVIEGELLLVKLPDYHIDGIYRVVDGLEYRLLFQPNVDNWVEPQPGDSIWKQHEFIGWVISYDGSPDNHWMEVSLEAFGDESDQLQKGDRLYLGNHRLVFQLLDQVVLGPANHLHLSWVSEIPSAKIAPTTPGIYNFEPFRLKHPTHSSLYQVGLRGADQITTNKDTGDTYETVNGTITPVNEHTLRLDFPTKDLRQTMSGYEIHRVQYPVNPKFGQPAPAQTRHPIMLVDSPGDDTKTRVYLRDPDIVLSPGQWVSCETLDESNHYHQIDSYDATTHSAVLKTPYQSDRTIHSLKVPNQEMAIDQSTELRRVRAHLTHSAIRDDRILTVYHPSNLDEEFSNHFIVRIGKTIDGRRTTNAEMNVIKNVESSGDGTVRLTLYFPIVNPHLEGDLVCQTYYYAILSKYLQKGSRQLEN